MTSVYFFGSFYAKSSSGDEREESREGWIVPRKFQRISCSLHPFLMVEVAGEQLSYVKTFGGQFRGRLVPKNFHLLQ